MRRVFSALVFFGLVSPACAQDFSFLRGSDTFMSSAPPATFSAPPPTFKVVSPTPIYHWWGIYAGVQGGYSSLTADLGNSQSEIAFLLRQTAIEQDEQISQWPVFGGSTSATSASLGGFLGYNVEWEKTVILGVELNYNHYSLSASSSGSLSRSFTDSTNLPPGHNYYYTVDVSGQSSARITDIATFRARAGWEVGDFLPYAFAGLATGRAEPSNSATVSYTAVDIPTVQVPPITTTLPNLLFGPASQTQGANGTLAVGVAAGVGLDVALTSNVFVRGEFEYISFAPFYAIQASVITGRLGVGVKF